MKKCLNDKIFQLISDVVSADNTPTYVIGGYVRDCILKRKTSDIDIVVVGSGINIAKKVAKSLPKSTRVNIFKNFGTAMIKYGPYEIEFVGARKESYRVDSRKPVVEDGTLEDDLNRRDFTINAMALSLSKENFGAFIDPFDGLTDLEKGIIRTPLNPETTFSDDPLRMLRAIRFASQLHFEIEENTFLAIRNQKDRLKIISQERITTEFNKILLSPKPSIGLKLLESSGLLEIFFPELHALKGVETLNSQAHKDNFYHTVKVVDNISHRTDDLWLRWAALLHDIAKPPTKKYEPGQGWTFHGHDYLGSKMVPRIFRKFKLPLNEKLKYVQKLVLLHLRPIVLSQEEVTDSAIRRLLFDAGDDIDDLMLLCEADITSKNEKKVKKHLGNFRLVRKKLQIIEEKDAVRNFQPPVSGDDIIQFFGINPGKEVGIIKNAIKEAILDGIIPNEREKAMEFMIQKGKELGLTPLHP